MELQAVPGFTMADLSASNSRAVPMCGRFNVIDNPGLRQLLQDLGIDLQLPTAVNVAPTEQVQSGAARRTGACDQCALVADPVLGQGGGPEVFHVQRTQ